METNFFQQITSLSTASSAEWTIFIKQSQDTGIIVSVLYKDENCTDPASKLIPPLTFPKHSPATFDSQFFESLESSIGKTVKLFCNMKAYEAQQEQALAKSKMEKEKTAELEKNKSDKQKRYEAAMKKADEFEADGKHREAWMKIPDPLEYSEHAEHIRQRKSELSAHFAPTLFS